MFENDEQPQGITNVRVKDGGTASDRSYPITVEPKTTTKADDLDRPDVSTLWSKLLSYYLNEVERQSENRAKMAKDDDFYDHEQWDEQDKAILEERGQMALVYNVTATAINWMLGTERRGRTDFRLLPRRKEGSKAAELKTDLLKYLADVNNSEFHISRSFADAVKAGVGWIESGVQADEEGEPIYDRFESWRNIIFDSAAQELDLSDARYMFRTKWVDLDTAKALFPKRTAVLETSRSGVMDYGYFLDSYGDDAMDVAEDEIQGADGSQIYSEGVNHVRNRVRLIEAWFKTPIKEKRMAGGDFTGEIYDEYSVGHNEDIQTGRAKIKDVVTYRVHVMIFTSAGVLWHSKSPYRHNAYPFTPIWCYRRGTNGLPYGVIRGMRDIQADLNKRASKALHILSTSKTIADHDAVDDWDAYREEVNRPDAIILKKAGKHLEIDVDRNLADAHFDIMSKDVNMIQSLTGITDENMGRTTNATSGKAIIARQDQGSLATAPIFDNLRYARNIHGSKMLSLAEQYMTEKKSFRITNKRGIAEFRDINNGLPENDVIRTKADFIISEDDFNATIRQSQATEFLDLLSKLAPVQPELVVNLLDLLVEMMDTPQRDEVVARIRSLTGQKDPDADVSEGPTPEEQAASEAEAAAMQMQARAAEANIGKIEAEAQEKSARAQKTSAEAMAAMKNLSGDELTRHKTAFELALQMLEAPAGANVADALLQEAAAAIAGPPLQQQPIEQPTQ